MSSDEVSQSQDDKGSNRSAEAATSGEAASNQATVLVRGETIAPKSPPTSSSEDHKSSPPRKEVSKEKVEAQARLPALNDDSDVGVQKAYTVTRDGEADLAFTGTLIASAAPSSAPKGEWQEFRVYETNAGKHVFSKITRKVSATEEDTHEAKVFDPSPSSMPSKLLKSAHDLTHTRPVMWTDAAVEFFGYDPPAKILYQKFGTQFEEHVS